MGKILPIILISGFFSFIFAQDEEIKRPESKNIINSISTELKLSAQQEERIKKAIEKQTKYFDEIMESYSKKNKELKKLEYEINELKYKMIKINKNIPDIIREFLDDDQKIKFDKIVNPPPKKEKISLKEENKPDESNVKKTTAQEQPKKKRKVLVRRKKKLIKDKGSDKEEVAIQTPITQEPTPQQEAKPKEEQQIESPVTEEEDVYYP